MKTIGITGGIGSGKTLVSSIFQSMGIPVFLADDEAKKMYDRFPEVADFVHREFGPGVMSEGKLDKAKLAQVVFNDAAALLKLNAIIHPLVSEAFDQWRREQDAPYIIKEAAIMIETGTYKNCDQVLLITSDEEIRIKRVMARSGLTEIQIRTRMKQQMTDEERRPYCHYEIRNNERELILPMVVEIDRAIRA